MNEEQLRDSEADMDNESESRLKLYTASVSLAELNAADLMVGATALDGSGVEFELEETDIQVN